MVCGPSKKEYVITPLCVVIEVPLSMCEMTP